MTELANPFSAIYSRLARIEELLLDIKHLPNAEVVTRDDEASFLTVAQASNFLGIAEKTLYSNIGKIPHLKRHGRLYFRKDELVGYLEGGRVKGGRK
ncbi:hypothetical protein BWI96_11770 [Siphonobacter sp. SORGH_AS_0500]|uniref:helix-turn-helix domain-containing protein n=1 Tax=Siphonobacter sp. SORGH_AS_0500 TaxID=1864824 RepID=UPI000CC68D9B|nr:helix-turn-helix domain-containing protein [Siphonobacter sp. SORGH_AS_0500]PKK36526.1 hypothetical protein BWI96_11770 [Siphonobacter sp. SORGH_AS_0500]